MAHLIPALRDRLQALEQEFETAEAALLDPDVLVDHRKVRDHSVRRAALKGPVDAWRQQSGPCGSLVRPFDHAVTSEPWQTKHVQFAMIPRDGGAIGRKDTFWFIMFELGPCTCSN